ncbi:hypothetical protein GCM10010909_08830 [Acidocella aquatica]|uniref:Uncharacterized protein n=1 Tax=Acidocella aquatica TaxID=1922313 RepID=A0ABQ6A186_9PROT|nr:hypothetical protein [Acidocella aquatica]GLR66204.1 hypothetical protein GCM10010909_08830 [Acidocella aquatica]
MRRIITSCFLSLVIYVIIFAGVVDRPLSLGLLDREIVQKTARLAALPSPKLVILAGSNGPYSHSCAVIGAMLNLPCENAGIAVGIGLDDLFIRYAPLLHTGDVLYMPMELQQYTATRAQYRAGVDGAFLLRHDRSVLGRLSPGRILGAVFCCDLADFLESLAEMPLAHAGFIEPRQLLAREYNRQGDRIDNLRANTDTALLRHSPRPVPDAQEIAGGYGRALIARFVGRETAQKIIVIGGLPTDFTSAELSASVIAAAASAYTENGGEFAVLPNHSQYPAEDFFNSEDHLAQPCQYKHSIAVAYALGKLLNRPAQPPSLIMARMAAACPF